MSEPTPPTEPFLLFACTVLGGITGILIALPFSLTSSTAALALIPFALVGGLIGRKRASRPFLYFLLFCVLVLSSLVFQQLTVADEKNFTP